MPRLQPGLLGLLDVGGVDFKPAMNEADQGTLYALSAMVAFALHIEQSVSLNGLTGPAGLTVHVGPTMRVLGGDLSSSQRANVLGSDSKVFYGLELGAAFRLLSILVVARASFLTGDKAIAGLTRLQFVPSVSFALPLTIVNDGPKLTPEEELKRAEADLARAKARKDCRSQGGPDGGEARGRCAA